MHVEQSERYQDAGELTLVLRKFQAGRLVHPSLGEWLEDWVRRHAVTLVTLAVFGTLAGGATLLSQHRGELDDTLRRFNGRLARVSADAQAHAEEGGQLEVLNARLENTLRTLEAKSNATISALRRQLRAALEKASREEGPPAFGPGRSTPRRLPSRSSSEAPNSRRRRIRPRPRSLRVESPEATGRVEGSRANPGEFRRAIRRSRGPKPSFPTAHAGRAIKVSRLWGGARWLTRRPSRFS